MDITAQHALQQCMNDLPDAVYGLDRQLQMTFINTSALQLWRRDADEVLGRPLVELLHRAE